LSRRCQPDNPTIHQSIKQIARREIVLPNDDELRAQLLDRKRVPDARGKLAVESKSDMKITLP
jgi:hypothetical protein